MDVVVGVVEGRDDVCVVVDDNCVVAAEGDDVAGIVVISDGVVENGCVIVLVILVIFSGSLDGRMTNFNSRERVTANTVKMTKEIPRMVRQRRCRHLCRSLFLASFKRYTSFLLCILYCTRSFNLKQKTNDCSRLLYACLSISNEQ
jgi:hypothetical protein